MTSKIDFLSKLRHQKSKQSLWLMREMSKYGRITVSRTIINGQFVPHVEMWLNNAVASTALDAPIEFILASRKASLFEKLMPQSSVGMSRAEELLQKLAKT
jgi:hypothetical protein